jgi:putative peptidoglycan lipid II flippase
VTNPSTSADRQIARAAGTVMAAFILSNLAGLVRQILVADAFGTGLEIDAFNAANRVSETLFTLVAGGALASAFIPTFTGLLTHKKRSRAWRLASAIVNLILLISASLGVLAAIFAPQIVRYILAPGFADNPLQEALTIDLMRLMLPAAVLFSLSGLLMGILNAHQIFFIPALTPSMYQIGMIIGVLLLAPRLGIYGLAWGVLIGAALHLLLQIPLLLRMRGRYFPTFGLELAPVREVLRLMGPRLLGVAVVQLNFWVNTRLASGMTAGSVTGILFGFTLMLMPQAAIAQSIAVAAMPTFSAQVALGKLDEMRASLASSLRGLLLLSIPASLGLMLLRQPLVAALYQRGEFTARSTELVAWALLWYGAGLVGHSVVEILARAFYSLHDTKTPVLVGTGAMTLNVIFSFAFSSLFANRGWMPHGGLALANSLATALEMIGLLVLMRRRLNGLQSERVLPAVFQSLIAASGMSLLLWLWIQQTVDRADWLVALGGVIFGAAIYALILFVLGNHELRKVSAALLSRLGQFSGR